MIQNILQLLEATARRVPDKAAYADATGSITWAQLESSARRIGSALAERVNPRSPVAVLMDARDARCVEAFLGAVYAGCFYIPLNPAVPMERLRLVLNILRPAAIVYDEKNAPAAQELQAASYSIISFGEAASAKHNQPLLTHIRAQSSVFDLLTVLFTSGSTGIPKGVTHSHRSMLAFTLAADEVFGFTEDTVFANQSPFFYANSVMDIYPPMALGASVTMIPAAALSFPRRFVEYLQETAATELTMTPSSYVRIANSGVLEGTALPALRHVIMLGEAMPWRPARQWMDVCKNAAFYNFYGSTEMFSVALYKIDRTFADGDILPAGRPFPLVHLLILDENGAEVPLGEAGEIVVSDPWLSCGYYRDAERTNAVFRSDPLGRGYRELFYHSGDIGRINELGELVVLGRRDAQIKHRGYRMELGEVECALRALDGWQDGCCLHDKETGDIYCFWEGTLGRRDLVDALKKKVPKYMLPDRYVHLEALPHTPNMKIDRVGLKTYFGAADAQDSMG